MRATLAILTVSLAACSSTDASGTYTLQFPSTAAAVATDTVQLFVFDILAPADRATKCADLIEGRKRGDRPTPSAPTVPANICELNIGHKALDIPFGEKAIMAVGQRAGNDFLIGCTVQTVGAGNLVVPVDLALIDVAQPVPATQCTSVGQFCAKECQ